MEASLFGRKALKDPNFVFDLRKGRCPNLRTIQRVREFMSARAFKFEASESSATSRVGAASYGCGVGNIIEFHFGSVRRPPSRPTRDGSGSRGCSSEFRAAAPIAFCRRGVGVVVMENKWDKDNGQSNRL